MELLVSVAMDEATELTVEDVERLALGDASVVVPMNTTDVDARPVDTELPENEEASCRLLKRLCVGAGRGSIRISPLLAALR